MNKFPNFREIIAKDKSVLFLLSIISFYIALIICLPFKTSMFTISLVTIGVTFLLSIAYHQLKDLVFRPKSLQTIPFKYFFLINLVIFSTYFYASYPCCAQVDSTFQWEQAQRGIFTDWHPALHTMLVWCLTKICNKPQFLLICNALAFMVLNSFLYHKISELGISKKIVKFMFFVTVFSPAVCSHFMTVWKDVTFSTVILGLVTIFLFTYCSQGKWIQKTTRIITLGILLTLASIFRHNGILFTVPFALVFLYLFYNKYVLKAIAIAICLFAFIKGPFYSYFNVTPHPQAKAELCGVPMVILSEIFTHNPDIMDQETKDFLLSIQDYDTWKANYVTGSWNSIKDLDQNDGSVFSIQCNDKLEAFSYHKVCSKALKFAILDPENTYNALVQLTSLVWRISFTSDGLTKIYPINLQNLSKTISIEQTTIQSQINIVKPKFPNSVMNQPSTHDSKLKGICQLLIIAHSILLCILWRPGLYLLILILSAFISFGRLRWKSFIIIFPVLAYNLGTMVLLCGYNDFRFFLWEVLTTFPYIIILFNSQKPLSKPNE